MNSKQPIITAALLLTCGSLQAQTVLYWDADANFANGVSGHGITNAWNANVNQKRWYDGTNNVAWSDGAIAVFAGDTNGTANIFGNTFFPVAHSLIFSNFAGYTISSAPAPKLTVTSGNIYVYADATITANLTNAPTDLTTGLRKLGPAKLSFPGANNNGVFGGLYVLEGTVALWDKQNIGGADQPLIVDGGTAELHTNMNLSTRLLYVGDQGATFDLPTTNDVWLFQQLRSTNGTITKVGAGNLSLGNINGGGATNVSEGVGAVLVNEGTLSVQSSYGSAIGSGPVTVAANGTLAGAGLIAGAVTVNGAISPTAGGATVSALPNMTLANGLDLSATGTYMWDLTAPVDDATGIAGKDFDRITITNGNLTLGGTSVLALRFGGTAAAPDLGDAFWQANHTWTVCQLSETASNPSASNFSALSNATYEAGTFSTSVDAGGNVALIFATAAVSAPQFESITSSGTNVAITWASASGSQYQVEYRTNLTAGTWTLLSNLTATGSLTTIEDAISDDPQRFYRVALLP